MNIIARVAFAFRRLRQRNGITFFIIIVFVVFVQRIILKSFLAFVNDLLPRSSKEFAVNISVNVDLQKYVVRHEERDIMLCDQLKYKSLVAVKRSRNLDGRDNSVMFLNLFGVEDGSIAFFVDL